MRTISIINQKGGCGKTTTSVNLSACLSEAGRKVLLVDLDPQGHSTLSFDYQPDKIQFTIYDAFATSRTNTFSWDKVLLKQSENLYIAPANLLLSFLERELANYIGREKILLARLMELDKPFDYVIIDCPPSLGLLTVNALTASSEAIVPIEPSFFSLHGLNKLLDTVRLQEEKTGHIIKVHALVTIFNNRARFDRELLREIQSYFGQSLLRTIIRMSVKLGEAASFGKPIGSYNRSSIAYEDYNALASEIMMQEEYCVTEDSGLALKPQPIDGGIIFRYKNPEAAAVMLAGDFNNWSPDSGLMEKRDMAGLWERLITLDPGTYQYRFVVDGKWIADPSNPIKADDNLGGVNSVITIG
ncbi:MAG: sporulation initiation inhibitor Soj [candidate division Zixibacteria bacterium CG_4_9_14_3_um_filter_46_8]|nr:MAG: sporulation initiation inhibitor Soj [candidate division Zixibacteria bacterium CG_4_9_14_3_um_filter_46_8]